MKTRRAADCAYTCLRLWRYSVCSWPWLLISWPHFAQNCRTTNNTLKSKPPPLNVLWWQNDLQSGFVIIFALIVTLTFDLWSPSLFSHQCTKTVKFVKIPQKVLRHGVRKRSGRRHQGRAHGSTDNPKTPAANGGGGIKLKNDHTQKQKPKNKKLVGFQPNTN